VDGERFDDLTLRPMLAAIDNLIFLLLVGVAALLRWLATRASNASKPNDSDNAPTPPPQRSIRESTSSDEEQIRRFLEALGQPRGTKIPPPVAPRTNVAPRPVAPVSPPRSAIPIPEIRRKSGRPAEGRPRVSGPVHEVTVEPAAPRRTYQPAQPVAARSEAPEFEVQDTSQPLVEIPVSRMSSPVAARTQPQQSLTLLQLLQTPDGLRQAVILREIFGPPRSLQPMQDLPGTA